MFHTRSNSEINPREPASTSDPSRTTAQTSAVRPRDLAGNSKPRIVEEHHIAGPTRRRRVPAKCCQRRGFSLLGGNIADLSALSRSSDDQAISTA